MSFNKLLLLTTALLTPLALAQNANNTKCAAGVHMIIARASTENPGPGVIGQVATDVMQQVPGSDMVAVDYPATLQNYQSSEGQGVTAMTKLVKDYAAACPNGKMALMGYSQGAQVALDVMCGTSEDGFTATPPLALAGNKTNNIVAVVLMGDPSHNTKAPWNAGTATNDGRFPRQNLQACTPMANKIVSFCNSGDTFCDNGNSLNVHLSYVQSNGNDATKFLVGKAKGVAIQKRFAA